MRRIPVLSRKQIGEIAERHLSVFRPEYLQFPQPVDVDKFAVEYLHLRQDFQYLSNSGIYLGMFVFTDSNRVEVYDEEKNEAKYIFEKADTIIIDKSLLENGQEGRYRFTMGHEIAHSLLHRPVADPYEEYLELYYGERPAFRCSFSDRDPGAEPTEKWSDLQWQEWQADAFSSALLMPRPAVRSLTARFSRRSGGRIEAEELIHEMARTFNVTVTAARVRLESLKVIDPQVEVTEQMQTDEEKIVRQMRERAQERAKSKEAEDALYDRRDMDLWNNVESAPIRRRRHR